MAVVFNQNDPNKDNEGSQQGEPGAPTPLGGGGGATSVSPQNKPTSSGRFTNIQNYIKANQKSNLGTRLGGEIQGVANAATKDIKTSGEQFGQKAEQGRTQFDEGFVKSTLDNPVDYLNKPVGPSTPNPAAPGGAQIDPNVAAFQKQLNATYGGPKDLENFQQLQGETQNARNIAGLGSSEAGRFSLLKNFFGGGGQYNQGQQTLDNLILQGSPQQSIGLQQARQKANQVAQTLAQTRAGAQEQAGQFGQEAADTASKTQAALTGAITGTTDPINELVAQTQASEDERAKVGQTIQDLLQGKAADKFSQITDPNQEIQNALQYAASQGVFNPEEVDRIIDFQRQLMTPTDQLTVMNSPGGQQGILGYGGIGRGKTVQLSSTPMLSQLKLNDLLRENMTNQLGQNINAGGLINDDQSARLQAYAKLASQTNPAIEKGDKYQSGRLGFNLQDIQDKINRDQANLRKESLIELPGAPQEVPMWDQIKRGLAPTAQQFQTDVNQDINEGGVSGFAKLGLLEPARLGIGLASQQLSGATQPFIQGAKELGSGDILEGAQTLGSAPANALLNVGQTPLGLIPENTFLAKEANVPFDTLRSALNAPQNAIKAGSQGDISKLAESLAAPVFTAAPGFNMIGGGGGGGAINIIKAIANPVGAIFCYAAGTPIRMEGGRYKDVDKIKIGDKLFLGGKVTGTGEALEKQVYEYKGCKVSGNHAVFNGTKFERVINCPGAKKIPGEHKVYPIVSENHIMVTKTHLGADFAETDESQHQNPKERLQALNSDRKLLSNLKLKNRLLFGNEDGNKKVY